MPLSQDEQAQLEHALDAAQQSGVRTHLRTHIVDLIHRLFPRVRAEYPGSGLALRLPMGMHPEWLPTTLLHHAVYIEIENEDPRVTTIYKSRSGRVGDIASAESRFLPRKDLPRRTALHRVLEDYLDQTDNGR